MSRWKIQKAVIWRYAQKGGLFMADMHARIVELCKEKGVNITQMCREAGIPRATLSELKMGRTVTLSPKNISKITSYFGITMDKLFNDQETEEKKETPTPENGSERKYEDIELTEAFMRADEATRQAIRLLLKLQ